MDACTVSGSISRATDGGQGPIRADPGPTTTRDPAEALLSSKGRTMQDWGEFGGQLGLVDPRGSATSSDSPALVRSGVWRRHRADGSVFLRALAALVCTIAVADAALQAALGQSTAPAEAADVALVLAADVSGSINPEEFRLQRQGYAQALSDARVVHAIVAGPQHAALLAYIEWSGSGQQRVIVPWLGLIRLTARVNSEIGFCVAS